MFVKGMKGGPAKRHVLFSLCGEDTYAGVVMAAVYNEITNVENAQTGEEKAKAGRNLAIEISIVQYSVQCAVNTLNTSI
uniref:Uncharacterized protein n=1 Tax=Ditylenchus dipsaci TaxID=166011 RepID=A0A915CLN9_9BILA